MSTVIENIDSLFSVKSDIRQAIEDKGVDMTNTPFTSFAVKISEIPSGGGDLKGIIEGTTTELIDNTVTYVRASGFQCMDNLETVSLPNVTSVGGYAFLSCININTVNLPKCTSIGTSAFYSCLKLTTLNLPVCETIGTAAFAYCSKSLTTVNLPKCKTILSLGFNNDSTITTVNLPVCEYIGSYAFQTCNNITSITMPSEPFFIGGGAFPSSVITRLGIEKQTGYIPNYAQTSIISGDYWNIWSASSTVLEVIDLPNGCGFPYSTMYSFKKLTSVHLGNYSGSLYSTAYPNNVLSGLSSLTTVSFPKITELGDSAFYYCYKLQNVSLPICEYIWSNAFYNCSAISEVNFPECSVVRDAAFANCISLQTVVLPKCESLWRSVFYNCKSLKSVYIGTEISSVCYIQSSAFYNTPIVNSTYLGYYGSIYVPMSLVNQYKTATNWVSYADRIVGV